MDLKRLSEDVASSIGQILRQEYRMVDGKWCLFALGKFARELDPDEIDWHTARRHAPFVEGGLEPSDPRWWDDPKE